MTTRLTTLPAMVAWAAISATGCAGSSSTPAVGAGGATADLLVLGGTFVTMDPARTVIADGGIAVADGAIAAIGTAAEIDAAWVADEVIAAAEHDMVIPGLVNGHGHAAMVLLRGIADDLALMDWLQNYIFPAEAATVTAESVRVGTQLAALEMIRTGTTTFVDMYYFEDEVAKVVDESGMRAIVGETVLEFPVPDAASADEALAYTRQMINRWKGHPRVIATAAPHAPYTLQPETLQRTVALTRELGVPVLIHLAETNDEVRQIRERYDRTPTEHLEAIGFLGPDVIAAHAVWLEDADIEILARNNVGVIHNPESNMKLASGTMRVEDLRLAGVAIGIGTDGAASNNDLDMFGATLLASLLQKHMRTDPTALPAAEALAMATIAGARALGLEAQIGSLEVGKRADLTIVSGNVLNLVPRYDPYSHLVYAARGDNVRVTVVDGQVLYKDGSFLTLDRDAILAEAWKMRDQIEAAVADTR
ncbi:MAG TPA: amidohydrolase family protein [Acidobacteriota bacterium]|nr:amidohydrolase family protein [Acidobacteriota bacterium]